MRKSVEKNGPGTEHLRLCLQLIVQSHLHQFDAGLTECKVEALCREVGIREVPLTHNARLAALQVAAVRILPLFK